MRRAFVVAAVVAAFAPAARAELPANLKEMIAEGEKWFKEAGNTDLDTGKRNEARRKAYTPLFEANKILNEHWDANPSDQSRIEDMLMKVGQMLHWLRKESPMGVLPIPGDKGGTKKLDWGPKPPDEPPVGNTPNDGAPPRGPGNPSPPTPGGPPAPAPGPGPAAPPAGPTAEELAKAAEDYERKHRFDMPGILERWQAVMTRNPDPTNPLFLKAAERAGKAQAALKDVYRKLRDDDPDSIKDVDAQEVKRMVVLLGREMDSKDAAVRERAAKLLGLLGSGDAAYVLVKTLRVEPEVQTMGAVASALVAIGGRRTAEQLSGLRNDDKGATRAYEVVEKLAASNPVDRRIALLEMGKFVLAKDAGISKRALDALVGAGAEGAPGLLEALGTNDTDARITIIGALGRTGNHRVAGRLAGFLIGGDVPNTIRTREAATAAIKALGDKAVPYLMEGLRGSTTKMYTGLILREMTGQMFSASRPGDWSAWWKRTHPDWKPGD